MKKLNPTFLILISILTLNSVYAYSSQGIVGSSQGILDNLISGGAPLIEAVLGDYTSPVGNLSYGEILFMKLLIFLILFVIIQAVLKKIPIFETSIGENKAVVTILSLAIPIIAVRFMSSSEMLYGVLLPYGMLGIAITTILPLLIFFFFVHNSGTGKIGRRTMWIFFTIIYLVLWLNRTDSIGKIGNQIYFWTIIILIINVLADGKIHSYFGLRTIKSLINETDETANINLQREYDIYSAFLTKHPENKSAKRKLEKIRKELYRRGLKQIE